MDSGQTDTEAIYREVVGEGVRVSGGHLCEAEAPTEATAETSAPPEENEAVTRRVILSLPKFYDNEIPPHTSARFAFDFAQNDPLS